MVETNTMPDKPPREARIQDLGRLRWLGVWLPVVGLAFVIGLVFAFVFRSGWYAHVAAYFAVMTIISIGAYFFSGSIFRVVRRQENQILRRNQELAALNAVGAVINESRDLEQVLSPALDKVLEVTGAESGEIFLWEEEGSDVLVLEAFCGLHPGAFQEITRFRRGEGFPGEIADKGKTIVLHDLPDRPGFLRGRVKEAGFRSYAGVPLVSKGKVLGVMGIFALSPQIPTTEDVALLEALGNQIGVAIENAALSARLEAMTVVEERHRIAREMHDGLAQELGYLYLKTGELEGDPSISAVRDNVREIKAVVARAYEDVRHAIFGLKVVVSRGMGLVATLAEYLHEFREQTGIPVKLKVADERATRFSPQVEIQLIRIIQEALSNVRRHAQARQGRVTFDSEGGEAKVIVEDDGRGFDPEEATRPGRVSFGLQTMRERAESAGGSLDVESEHGLGTRVIIRLPLVGKEVRDGADENSPGR
jgi:signal transduction histidine kinase